MTTQEIVDRFKYHNADKEKIPKLEKTREMFMEMAFYINNLLPDCREKALCLTNIEQAQFWANAGIVRPKDEGEK